MIDQVLLVKKHFEETEELLRRVSEKNIASWFLNQGFFPEKYVLPPSFQVSNFDLQDKPFHQDFSKLKSKNKSQSLKSLSYPKTLLTSRKFAIQHPHYFHDIIFHMMEEWSFVLEHLFNKTNNIYSYSLPIPVSKNTKTGLSNLRSGRMIYEWIEMAEKHLVVDSVNYQYVIRTDITNFYSSIYTHSIGWALHGREGAFNDKECSLLGNKIDRLIQYSNEAKTNGIPVGSALSDLIAEIILAGIDREISQSLEKNQTNFVGMRFKDDYRILCNTKDEAEYILKTIASSHSEYNLSINENKTHILKLPDGLYRRHDRLYFPYSLREKKKISFKDFEYTLLKTLDIHREYPGTSILEKFISELFTNKDRRLKIDFSNKKREKGQQIKKVISLFFLVKRESEKILCHVLAIAEQLFNDYKREYPDLKDYLRATIVNEIKTCSEKESVFQTVWLIFFCRYMRFGIKPEEFEQLIGNEKVKKSEFVQSILQSKQKIFSDSNISLFKTPKNCRDVTLAEYLAIY